MPKRVRLDRVTIVAAAAELADEKGLEALTLQGVAGRLHRNISSLYSHIESIDDLRREVALVGIREIGEELWAAALGRSGAGALIAIAEAYRSYVRRHPGRYDAHLRVGPSADPVWREASRRTAEATRAVFRSFGLEEEQALAAHRVFSATIRGFAITERLELIRRDEADVTFRQLMYLFVRAVERRDWPEMDGEPAGPTAPASVARTAPARHGVPAMPDALLPPAADADEGCLT